MRPLRVLPSSLVIVVLLLALLGFADATYLSVEHFLGVIPPCSITGGCEKVLTSSYAAIAGIPVSLLGVLYYLSIVIGVLILLESKYITKRVKENSEMFRLSLLLTIPGLLMSLWFTGAQVFILHSYCTYCLGSASITLLLFILSIVILKKYGAIDTSKMN